MCNRPTLRSATAKIVHAPRFSQDEQNLYRSPFGPPKFPMNFTKLEFRVPPQRTFSLTSCTLQTFLYLSRTKMEGIVKFALTSQAWKPSASLLMLYPHLFLHSINFLVVVNHFSTKKPPIFGRRLNF